MKNLACAFTGRSNSGKTTLIEKLSKILSPSFKVAIIKHDPKDKARFDTKGKDSYRFYQSGANVAVVSDVKTTIMLQESRTIKSIADSFGEVDYLFVEGLKEIPLPRIAVMRGAVEERFFPHILAVAIDDTIRREDIPSGIEILDLNNPCEILAWIEKNGANIKELV
ncbi:MAG: molybdopterin-guanine dinucleotide biosynthesis protein B [Wolinella sp.]